MAATGTPTPNIGLRIPQGTDPASVDDINYNSNLIDTKLGAVGNDSVQDQIDALNSKLSGTKFLTFNVNNGSVTINLGNVFRGILFSSSAYSSEEGIYSIRTSSTGGVSTGTFFAATGLTLNTSVDNKLTISSTRYVEFTLIITTGTASKA